MKKLFICITFAFFCIFFCGCTDFQADFGIDESCNAYMKYHIQMDLNDIDSEYAQDIKDGLTYFCDYYENILGFTVERDIFDNKKTAKVDLVYTSECDTYAEAFDELKKMLTDPERTPFLTVEMASDTAEFEEAYSFSAQTDLSKIIATSGYEKFPKDLKEMIASGIDKTKGRFTITLPATTIVESAGDTKLSGNFCTEEVALSLEEPLSLKLITRLSRENGLPAAVATDESIKQIHARIALYRGLAIGFIALAAIAGVLFLIISKKRRAILGKTDTPAGDVSGEE